MRPRLTTLIALAALAACAAVLSACGGDTTDNRNASNEGVYVDIGHLKYQVQLSRELNPYDNEDASYFAGMAPADRVLSPSQAWFGVFVLAFNKHDQSYPASNDYYITDTQGLVYRPTPVPGENPFAYHAAAVAPHDQLPTKGSPAYDGPTGGLVLLFKVPLTSFDNRPLVLHIGDPADAKIRAIVELDV
jgi:hypothetical protein